jgi:hypothetical protein
VALTEGFQRAALVAACLSLGAALAAGVLLRRAERAGARTEAAIAPTADPAFAVGDEIAR